MAENMPRISAEQAKHETSEAIERAKAGEVSKEDTLGRVNAEMAPLLRDLLNLTQKRYMAKGPELLQIDATLKELSSQLEPYLERVKKITGR